MSARARAHINRGLPDPIWLLDPGQVTQLVMLWGELPPSEGSGGAELPIRPGYRGVSVDEAPGRWWLAAAGLVTFRDGAGRSVTRRDPERQFEEFVLATAPPGLLPSDVESGVGTSPGRRTPSHSPSAD